MGYFYGITGAKNQIVVGNMQKLKFERLIYYKLILLAGLSIFFFTSYNLTNWYTANLSDVGSLFFSWESLIPLWPWTIVPYWSIDLMYGLAILLATSKQSLKILCLRLFSAQIICITCFLIFPLKFSFERPNLDGFLGLWFDVLMGFDKPFNQAPSLHITLLVILWQFYNCYFQSKFNQLLLHVWCFLIALSVLTTWQHHFFDVPTGLWAGCFCIWLWPENGMTPLKSKSYAKQYTWSGIYFLLFLLSLILAIYIGGIGLWLLWLAGAFVLVSANYLVFGATGFQKQANGHFPFAITILYLPYFAIMWLNSRLWTLKNKPADFIMDSVYLGRIASHNTLQTKRIVSIVDLCAELPIGQFNGHYSLIPILDMTPLSIKQCQLAAETIDQFQKQGSVLVCCALGYSRSATAVIAWLLLTKRAANVEDAITKVKTARCSVVISSKQKALLINWFNRISKENSDGKCK
ncbi:Ser/Thr and Tyr protein phosphatase (dual specificity) [Gilliamella apicola]|uniref:phosphatase PAP2/dual specificity phosphatase family protein n=1 Tax=Gilliamella apicola TaxID=1196095 RepID=UPI00042F09D4|nr:phosphatase PAP2/dual specificity phosphatase family protein [Gilliamella apicola]AHN26166.1 Ser/Thr and Tyr protein phosphatase (dual specificity) [Gilliamella apicola]PXV93873.1 dual specificity protein phosphatase-like protein [Gilliamella apicola]